MTKRKKPAVRVRATVRVKAYDVVARAVEEGVAYGWQRAHKHDDTPDADAIREQVALSVQAMLTEVLDFDGGDS